MPFNFPPPTPPMRLGLAVSANTEISGNFPQVYWLRENHWFRPLKSRFWDKSENSALP